MNNIIIWVLLWWKRTVNDLHSQMLVNNIHENFSSIMKVNFALFSELPTTNR